MAIEFFDDIDPILREENRRNTFLTTGDRGEALFALRFREKSDEKGEERQERMLSDV